MKAATGSTGSPAPSTPPGATTRPAPIASPGASALPAPLLQVAGLGVSFATSRGPLAALRGLGFSLERGGTLGLVGESGSGKSVAALALMELLGEQALLSGSMKLDGKELTALEGRERRSIRGGRMAMVFQDPMTSLNPCLRIGEQFAESLGLGGLRGRRALRRKAAEWLDQVGVGDPEARLDAYPHELSGGLRQRALIALALCREPDLLIADEPTTALDATVQAQVMDLIQTQQRRRGMALILISHDLGLVAQACQRILVLYAGRPLELGEAGTLLEAPRHPYTWGLLESARLAAEPKAPLRELPGSLPDPLAPPPGCAFAARCPRVRDLCRAQDPAWSCEDRGGPGAEGRSWRCHAPLRAGGEAP